MNCRPKVPAFVNSLQGEIDNHDSVLLHDPEQQEESDHAVERQRRAKNPKREQTADDRRHDCRKQNRDGVDITFVKNSKDHIHDKNGGEQKQRQSSEKLAKDKRLALKRCLNARKLLMHLSERIFDEFRRIADGNTG